MGLAMVHGIVHDHGGHLGVETQPGAGSTFRVLLPLAASQPAAMPLPLLSPAPARTPLQGRVMVVEDESMVGEFMGELLGGWGLEVMLQRDPTKALQWLADPAHAVDLVITDQTMPQLTGLELAERLRALRPRLPVLLYTGNASELQGAELQRCGVSKALRKPLDPDVLRATVRQLLGQREADDGGELEVIGLA
jgi:CheY-like chemotaxis protein